MTTVRARCPSSTEFHEMSAESVGVVVEGKSWRASWWCDECGELHLTPRFGIQIAQELAMAGAVTPLAR